MDAQNQRCRNGNGVTLIFQGIGIQIHRTCVYVDVDMGMHACMHACMHTYIHTSIHDIQNFLTDGLPNFVRYGASLTYLQYTGPLL